MSYIFSQWSKTLRSAKRIRNSVCISLLTQHGTYVHSYSFQRSMHSKGSGQMTFAQGLFDGQLRSKFLAIVCKQIKRREKRVFTQFEVRGSSNDRNPTTERSLFNCQILIVLLNMLLKMVNIPPVPTVCRSLRVVMANVFLPI